VPECFHIMEGDGGLHCPHDPNAGIACIPGDVGFFGANGSLTVVGQRRTSSSRTAVSSSRASSLKAQRNKTDMDNAHGAAQLVRSGWYRDVHVKSEASYRLRLLLTHRRTLKRKFLDLDNEIRHSLKVFGVKLSAVGRAVSWLEYAS
jgi:hypothetical protein